MGIWLHTKSTAGGDFGNQIACCCWYLEVPARGTGTKVHNVKPINGYRWKTQLRYRRLRQQISDRSIHQVTVDFQEFFADAEIALWEWQY